MSMRIAVCVDDTDDLTKTTSTGKVADSLRDEVIALGGAIELGVSRHQLPVLETIKYTSHNSSMCFTGSLPDEESLLAFRRRAEELVVRGSVPAADPGLCIFRFPEIEDEHAMKLLIGYGLRAKENYVTKEEAYRVAAAIPTLSLTEHGGGGEGIIGALAGVALRLSGDDGRFRGKLKGNFGAGPLTVREFITLAGDESSVQVCSLEKAPLPAETVISLPDKIKAVLLHGKKTVIATQDEQGAWRVVDAEEIKSLYDPHPRWRACCDKFEFDNDIEEYGDSSNEKLCSNCLYRRWIQGGFSCSIQETPVSVA